MNITNDDILKQLKLSRRFSTIKREIITQQIVTKKVQEEKIIIDDRESQEAADHFRIAHNLLTATDTMQWLEEHNLNLDDFETIIYQDLLADKLAKFLFESQVENYFYEHQIDYQQAIIYEIVLDDFDLAIELFFGIQEGELSFWDLAHKYIRDRELRRCGGYKGILKRSELKPEISAAVFAAKPPQILKPINIDKQTYLVFVEEIIQPELDDKLRETIIQDLYEQWLQQQLNSYLK
ncbi:hypothetical protein Xen7305DRAFT_00048140 [Xenococcus sp. PCC 7305]|uniref:peptidylprolyl isomerase n=1 Tax=Xenococcus sp. PCC 7305 TaxID=102125 RepID=UPI0002AD0449|nr:peptidylprolyl isomerase [Xenococcus sp. PCC 7305]ELS05075.1 hypothetical protein Xen7305DRAFT_00048140 [Xenococcus sp. PCC 7305]